MTAGAIERLPPAAAPSSVAALAAGVAHEINNPLAGVLANLHLAAEELARLPSGPPAGQTESIALSLRDAADAAERIRAIVGALQTFSRSPESGAGGADLHRAIDAALSRADGERLPAEPAPQPARRGRVLVVDDEPMLVDAVCRMLAREHTVTGFTSPRAALASLASGEEYDVVLCDLMMPELSGAELHAELQRSVPRMAGRIIFMSGCAHSPCVREFLSHALHPWIEKPFDPAALRRLITSCMGDPEARPPAPAGEPGSSRPVPPA